MKITQLSDKKLLEEMKLFVKKERKMTLLVIEHLEEIERRKLYCNLKYSSLLQYCVNELGYSESQANRRINAMKAAKRIPLVKKKIDEGSMTLTSVNLFSAANKEFNLSSHEQAKLISKMEHKSRKQCQEVINKFRLEKTINSQREMKNSLEYRAGDKIKMMDNDFNFSAEEVITYLVTRPIAPVPLRNHHIESKKEASSEHKKYTSQKVKKIVTTRAGLKCESCGSTSQLEYKNSRPIAFGEKNRQRILCRHCNLKNRIGKFFSKRVKK